MSGKTRPGSDYAAALERIRTDPQYLRNLEWGEPRAGHPEGAVRDHIAEIEANLRGLADRLSGVEIEKLELLIHTHDTFKGDAAPGVAITDPASHASLARAFLARFCSDEDLLAMVQYHDEPFALWRQAQTKGSYNPQRMNALIGNIKDWDLFLAFNIIDGCTAGKSREPLRWFFEELGGRVTSRFTAADILP